MPTGGCYRAIDPVAGMTMWGQSAWQPFRGSWVGLNVGSHPAADLQLAGQSEGARRASLAQNASREQVTGKYKSCAGNMNPIFLPLLSLKFEGL